MSSPSKSQDLRGGVATLMGLRGFVEAQSQQLQAAIGEHNQAAANGAPPAPAPARMRLPTALKSRDDMTGKGLPFKHSRIHLAVETSRAGGGQKA